jgi:Glyoxalase/Bleomycin resistance protein/Dioxygenase superfamily
VFDYQRTFHVGVRVPDIDLAMAEIGAAQGVTWASVQHADDRTVWTPERGLEQVALTFVYSCEGPHRVELLQGSAGSVWDCGDRPGLHHVGVWSDDVAADTERCLAAGWTLTAAAKAPDGGAAPVRDVVGGWPHGSRTRRLTAPRLSGRAGDGAGSRGAS